MSVDPASAATPWLLGSTEPEDAEAHGADVSRLSRDLGELADALTRARAGIVAIEPPVTAVGSPSILAATQELETLVWFMREQGIEPQLCDRIDGCVGNIRAACAVPDPTAEPTRAIAAVLADLEGRLHSIRTALDSGAYAQEPFDDLSTLPAANANSPASVRPVAIEEQSHAEVAAFVPDTTEETENLAGAIMEAGSEPALFLEQPGADMEPGTAAAVDAPAQPGTIVEPGALTVEDDASAEAYVVAEPGAIVEPSADIVESVGAAGTEVIAQPGAFMEPGPAIVECAAVAETDAFTEDAARLSVETIRVVVPGSPDEISPTEGASTETWPDASPAEGSPAEELKRYFDDETTTSTGGQSSPRLTPRLMEVELDRLLDAEASAAFTASHWREPEPAADAAPQDETSTVEATPVVEAAPALGAPAAVDITAPVEETPPAGTIALGEPIPLIEPPPEAEPIALSEPTTAEPIALSEPAPSAEPTAPIEPTPPAEPIALSEPTPPAEPIAPIEPTLPAEPIAMSEPTPPAEASALSQPTPPAQPTAPEQLVAPAVIAPLQPEPPKVVKPVVPKPPRRVAEIAKDKFTDVMALSEAERIALFS